MKRSKSRIIASLVFCTLITGCAADILDANKIINNTSPTVSSPQITGTSGLLPDARSKALLEEAGIGDSLQHHLAIEQAITGSPLIAGNYTRILRDGAETFPAIFAAISEAHNHVNLEYFILEDIQSGGTKLSDLLIRKQRAGVSVNIIYDSFGSGDTADAFFDRLQKAGVRLLKYNPVNPLELHHGYSPNDRDHRKILVVDGYTAIVGGVNLSTTYLQHELGKSMGPQGTRPSQWRDTDLEIQGPAVARLEKLFLRHWAEQKGPALNQGNFFPKMYGRGSELVRIIGSTPEKEIPRYYVTLLSAIRSARTSIWLMTAYFVPTHEEKEDLMEAARRGVDVRVLLPGESDSSLALAAQHSSYTDLLEAGVKIYESHDEVLHSKTVVIDGVWSAIGSSNIDYRSIVFNDEVDAVVVGKNTGRELQEMYKKDIDKADPVDLKKWKNRPLPDRIHEGYSHLWQSML